MTSLDIDMAIRFLRPGVGYSLDGCDPLTIVMADNSIPPTEQELIDTYSKLAYRDERQQAYPPIEEQLDALWEGGEELEAMRLKIQEVNTRFPKPRV